MPASSLFADWTKASTLSFAATDLIQHLIKLVASDVCTFRHNTQASYRFVDTARTLYDAINALIQQVDDNGSWAEFEKYTAAIDPLEDALIKFQLEADLLDQKFYLNDATSVTDCCAFINRWETSRKLIRDWLDELCANKHLLELLRPLGSENNEDIEVVYEHDDRVLLNDLAVAVKKYSSEKTTLAKFSKKVHRILHEVSEGVGLLKDQLSQTTSKPEHSNVLAIKSVMVVYGFMELGVRENIPVATRLQLKSEKVWLDAKQLLDAVFKYIQGGKDYGPTYQLYQAFFEQLTQLSSIGLPAAYPKLLQIVGTIGRAYYAQSLLLVKLCHKAAMHYQKADDKNDKQYVALENALDRTLDALQTVVNSLKAGIDTTNPSGLKDFDPNSYDKELFSEALKELTLCFTELNLPGLENSEAELEKAQNMDKTRMLAAKAKIEKMKGPLEADSTKLVEVTVRVRAKGNDIGKYVALVQRSTRLTAIGWSAARDDKLKDVVKGTDFKFEQEVAGASNPAKPHQPYPTPIPRYRATKFSHRRDLKEEGDTLSDEEMEVEEAMGDLRVYGHNFLIPMGKQMTLDEENADVGEPSEPGSTDTTSRSRSRSPTRSASASQADEGVTDLDADMQDLDADIPNEDSEADQSVADSERVDEGL